MQPPSPRRNLFPWITAGAYLALLAVYLLYWNYAEYFVDDWFLTQQFRKASQGGLAGVLGFAADAARNNVYRVFRTQWLSILYGYLVTALGGYSPRFNFVVLLVLHGTCCWLLCQALWRLGLERGLAFLAGALYLLSPAVHFALFTYLTNSFFVFSTLWVLLLLWWFARQEKQASWSSGLVAAVFAVAGMFSGEQNFLLLWALLPLAGWCFSRSFLRSATPVWAALGMVGGAYLLWVNRVAVWHAGFGKRYEWTWSQVGTSAGWLGDELWRLTGLPSDAPFQISLRGGEVFWALGIAVFVAALVGLWGGPPGPRPAPRPAFARPFLHATEAGQGAGCGPGGPPHQILMFALIALLLGYGPVLLIGGGYSRLRYHYAASPYLAILLAAACWIGARGRWRRIAPAVLGGALAGFFTLNAMADIRQSWIPQSIYQRALEAELRKMKNLEPGDILVVSGTSFEIGAAQHFSMHSSVSAKPFAEWAIGVAPLEVFVDIKDLHGRLMLFQYDYQRALAETEIRRLHVLVSSHQGTFSSCDWLAQEVTPGRFRIFALKGTPWRAGIEGSTFSRDQLTLLEDRIYFAKAARADGVKSPVADR